MVIFQENDFLENDLKKCHIFFHIFCKMNGALNSQDLIGLNTIEDQQNQGRRRKKKEKKQDLIDLNIKSFLM